MSVLRNEFAMVEVEKDESANGARLLIRDVMTGNCIYLDPLELEALTRRAHDHFIPLLDSADSSQVEAEPRLGTVHKWDV